MLRGACGAGIKERSGFFMLFVKPDLMYNKSNDTVKELTMKKNVVLACMAGMMLLVASCASAPDKSTGAINDLSLARTAAEDSRAKALEIKADVAVAGLFTDADAVYTKAKESDQADAPEAALAGYNQTITLFTTAYNEAKAKRDAAMNALDTAERERKTSEDVLRLMEDEQNAEEGARNE